MILRIVSSASVVLLLFATPANADPKDWLLDDRDKTAPSGTSADTSTVKSRVEPDAIFDAVKKAQAQYDSGDYAGSLATLKTQEPILAKENKVWTWLVLWDEKFCLQKLHQQSEVQAVSLRIAEINKTYQLCSPTQFQLIGNNAGSRAAAGAMVALTAMNSKIPLSLVRTSDDGAYAMRFIDVPGWMENYKTGAKLKAEGKYAEAEPYLLTAIKYGEAQHGTPRELSLVYSLLGGVYRYLGRPDDSIAKYNKAISLIEQSDAQYSPDYATVLDNIAQVYSEKKDFEKAAALQQKSISIYKKVLKPDAPDLAEVICNYADTLTRLGKPKEAETTYLEGIALYKKTLPPNDVRLAFAHDNLGGLYANTGRLQEGAALQQSALASFKSNLGPTHPDVNICVVNVSSTLAKSGRYDEARHLIEEQITTLKAANSPTLPSFLRSAGHVMNYILGAQAHR